MSFKAWIPHGIWVFDLENSAGGYFEKPIREENMVPNETPTESSIMNEAINRMKAEFNANPALVIAVTAGLLTAVAKLLDASTRRANAKSWALEVERRRMM